MLQKILRRARGASHAPMPRTGSADRRTVVALPTTRDAYRAPADRDPHASGAAPARPLRGYFQAVEALHTTNRLVLSPKGWRDGPPFTQEALKVLRSAGFSPVAAGYIAVIRRLQGEVPMEALRDECVDELWNVVIAQDEPMIMASWRRWDTPRLQAFTQPLSCGEAWHTWRHRTGAAPVIDDALVIRADQARDCERSLLAIAHSVRAGETVERARTRAEFDPLARSYIELLEQTAKNTALRVAATAPLPKAASSPTKVSSMEAGLPTGRLLAAAIGIVTRFDLAAADYSKAMRQAADNRSSPEAAARGEQEVEFHRAARATAAAHLDAAQAMAAAVVRVAESSGNAEILDTAHYWAARALLARAEVSPAEDLPSLRVQAMLHQSRMPNATPVASVRSGIVRWLVATLPGGSVKIHDQPVQTLQSVRGHIGELSGVERFILTAMADDVLSSPPPGSRAQDMIAILETAAEIARHGYDRYDRNIAAVRQRALYQLQAAELYMAERLFPASLALAQEAFRWAVENDNETCADRAVALMASNLLSLRASRNPEVLLQRAVQICGATIEQFQQFRWMAEGREAWGIAAAYVLVEVLLQWHSGQPQRAAALVREHADRYLEIMRGSQGDHQWVAAIEWLRATIALQ